jgi:hypothetical protein
VVSDAHDPRPRRLHPDPPHPPHGRGRRRPHARARHLGIDNADQRRYALEEGFDEYLPKPVHEDIVATVARMVSPRR